MKDAESMTCNDVETSARSRARNPPQHRDDLDSLAAALATIPRSEQASVVDHVAVLASWDF